MRADRPQFLLFGMGPGRRKILYIQGGQLLDALTLEPIRNWEVEQESIDASEYRVAIETGGSVVIVAEDEYGVWIESNGDREFLTRGERVTLPRFEGHPHAPWLRALHGELLVNCMPQGPVPNLWVYTRPWYRDAAMMLMCFQATGNFGLLEPWVMGLNKVWDRNNNGDAEADNPGQVLWMLSLFDAGKHPLVEKVLEAVPDYQKDNYIVGRTDYAQHPVYQTKWLKYGLQSLGLDDPYTIPEIYDSYSSLFWMDFREAHVDGERFSGRALELYPYLNWAEAHFFNGPFPEPLGELHCPLTREGRGSEAYYWRLNRLAELGAIPGEQAAEYMCTPHTWHAAEIFLYVLEKTD